MCVYCNMGDWAFRHNPPFPVDPLTYPTIPQPITPGPHPRWSLQQLKEYRDLLKEIKEMEEKIGCPCEPNKEARYIELYDDQIRTFTNTTIINYGDNEGSGG